MQILHHKLLPLSFFLRTMHLAYSCCCAHKSSCVRHRYHVCCVLEIPFPTNQTTLVSQFLLNHTYLPTPTLIPGNAPAHRPFRSPTSSARTDRTHYQEIVGRCRSPRTPRASSGRCSRTRSPSSSTRWPVRRISVGMGSPAISNALLPIASPIGAGASARGLHGGGGAGDLEMTTLSTGTANGTRGNGAHALAHGGALAFEGMNSADRLSGGVARRSPTSPAGSKALLT